MKKSLKKFKKRSQIRKLRSLFSQLIHLRDKNRCQKNDCTAKGKYLHTSHIYPKGQYPSMQFIPDNALLLCYAHHINWWHKNPIEAREWIEDFLGAKRFANLRTRVQITVPMDKSFFEQTEMELREILKNDVPQWNGNWKP